MGEGNQSDTQILNNFVETLSAPLQQAMAEGSPKVVVESVTSVVNSLEPELAAAFRSGNPSVIQAVLGGATTTQMVVNDLIRTGSSLTGLPPGVQQLVDQRVKEIQEKQAAENDALKKLVAGTLGVAVMASTAEAGMYYGGEGNSSYKNKDYADMSAAEKATYLNYVANLSYEEWQAKSPQDQKKMVTNTQLMADEKMTTTANDQTIADYEKLLKERGVAQEEVTKRLQSVTDAASLQGPPDENPGSYNAKSDLHNTIEKINKLEDPEMREAALRKLASNQEYTAAFLAAMGLSTGQNELNNGKSDTAYDILKREAERMREAALQTEALKKQAAQAMQSTAEMKNGSSPEAAATAVNEARTLGDKSVELQRSINQEVAGSDAYQGSTKAMQAANYAAAELRATAAAPAADDDFASSATTAQTRPPTITATALGPGGAAGLAQLGAPETVAANDVPGVEGPQQRRTPTASMGAGA